MFLPLLPHLLAEHSFLLKMDVKSQRNVLISLMWLLGHVPRPVLRAWWKTAPTEQLGTFVELLVMCTELFKYEGMKKRREDQVYESILASELDSVFSDCGGNPNSPLNHPKI